MKNPPQIRSHICLTLGLLGAILAGCTPPVSQPQQPFPDDTTPSQVPSSTVPSQPTPASEEYTPVKNVSGKRQSGWPAWCRTGLKFAPDVSAPGNVDRSFWVFIMNFIEVPGGNPVGCLAVFDPGHDTPDLFVPVTSCHTTSGAVSYNEGRAGFQKGMLSCDLNMPELVNETARINNLKANLEPTYVYTNFAIVVSSIASPEILTEPTPRYTLVQYVPQKPNVQDTVALSISGESDANAKHVEWSASTRTNNTTLIQSTQKFTRSVDSQFNVSSQILTGTLQHFFDFPGMTPPPTSLGPNQAIESINFGLVGQVDIGGIPGNTFKGYIDDFIIDPTGGSKGGST